MFDVSCTANLDMQNHTTVVCFLKQYYKVHSQSTSIDKTWNFSLQNHGRLFEHTKKKQIIIYTMIYDT